MAYEMNMNSEKSIRVLLEEKKIFFDLLKIDRMHVFTDFNVNIA